MKIVQMNLDLGEEPKGLWKLQSQETYNLD